MNDSDKFKIEQVPEKSMLRIALTGHWDLATVDSYKNAVERAVAEMHKAGCARGGLLVLVDTRSGSVQSQDVIASYREKFGRGDFSPRRLATLVSSALLKRQVERIAIPNQRLFIDEAEAEAWLLDK